MKFNWITGSPTSLTNEKSNLELEYSLRRKITKYLLQRIDNECEGDFSSFHFNVDLVQKKITISDETPENYRAILLTDFEQEIGHNCC